VGRRNLGAVEALASREGRAGLSIGRLLVLYLVPSALFKDLTAGAPSMRAEALRYNRRHRRMLLAYARRWAVIAIGCLAAITRLDGLARAHPLLWIPLAVLEAGFSSGLVISFLSIAAHIVLGLES
jgi:hypothetical protein